MPGAALIGSALRGTVAAALLLALAACEQEPGFTEAPPETVAASAAGGGFDFYVLALSWSPSYCASEGAEADRQQCGGGRPHAFIVHGLWPQFERGFPEHCGGEREVGRERVRAMADLTPSAGLVRHQWRKHGTCSGLSQDDYFATLRRAREAVVIPPLFRQPGEARTVNPREAENAFLASNRGLPADGVAVTCDDGLLREVRLCFTKALAFRSCPEVDRRSCRASRVSMPAAPGG